MGTNEVPDGCTGFGWLKKLFGIKQMPWAECCLQHDIAYIEQNESREDADWVFRECVKHMGYPIRAYLMWIIVRLLGGFWYYT